MPQTTRSAESAALTIPGCKARELPLSSAQEKRKLRDSTTEYLARPLAATKGVRSQKSEEKARTADRNVCHTLAPVNLRSGRGNLVWQKPVAHQVEMFCAPFGALKARYLSARPVRAGYADDAT